MPLPPATPPPENVWNGDVIARQQIVENVPAGYEDPAKALNSLDAMDDYYDSIGDLGAPLADGLEKSKKNNEFSEETSAKNRSEASKASDNSPEKKVEEPTLDQSIAKENAIAEKSAADFDAFEQGATNQFSPGEGPYARTQLNDIKSTDQDPTASIEPNSSEQANPISNNANLEV